MMDEGGSKLGQNLIMNAVVELYALDVETGQHIDQTASIVGDG